MKHFSFFFFILLAFLTACSPVVQPEQLEIEKEINLGGGENIAQTFVAEYDGLIGMEIAFKSYTPSTIFYRIQTQSEEEIVLSRGEVPVEANSSAVFVRLPFEPQPNSSRIGYNLSVETDSQVSLAVPVAPGATYLNGAAYQNDQPLSDTQLVFRLVYDPVWLVWGLVKEFIAWLGWLLAAGFLFVLPGWGVMAAWKGWDALSWGEKLGLSAGVGLGLYPVLVLWANVIGLQFGALFAWGPPLISAGWLLWKYRHYKLDVSALRLQIRRPQVFLFLIVILLTFLSRFWIIRFLVAPSWGDSVQHAFLAQLFLDNGGLFQSWLPYAPYESLSTHFGFSLHTALFAWLTGVEIPQATLITGQLINGVAILSLYPLAMLISDNNQWAGMGVLVLAGLLSPMPNFYVNWGRYAQLDGQAILPVAVWLLVNGVKDQIGWKWKITIAGVVLTGMTLTYLRMPLYYAPFVLAWLLVVVYPVWKFDWRRWVRAVLILGGVGIFAGVLFLPWWFRITQSFLGEMVGATVTNTFSWQYVVADYQQWIAWRIYVPPVLAWVSGVALGWGLIRRQGWVIAIGLWAVILSSLVALQMINLPGAALMQNFAVLIALYIPVGLLSGWLAGELMQWIAQNRLGHVVVSLLILSAALWGAGSQRAVLQNDFVMVTSPDLSAMAWIKENTHPDAVFLVESYPIMDGNSGVGADAGWWLPLLAGRANTMPPQYALLTENPIAAGYSQRVVQLVNALTDNPLDEPENIAQLCSWGITHAYIGQRQGGIGFGVNQMFTVEDLEHNPFFEPVYQENRVAIFAFDRAQCR